MDAPPPKTIRVVAALVAHEGRYLITQRRAQAVLPLMWEFPGGRVEAGESDAIALEREMFERLGVRTRAGELISFVQHPYERYKVELYLYDCAIVEGEPSAKGVSDFRWVRSAEFDDYEFTPADEASMSALLGEEPE